MREANNAPGVPVYDGPATPIKGAAYDTTNFDVQAVKKPTQENSLFLLLNQVLVFLQILLEELQLNKYLNFLRKRKN